MNGSSGFHRLIGLALATCLLSCQAKKAEVKRDPLVAMEEKVFEQPGRGESYVLTYNQVFLWPNGIEDGKVARVFDLTKEMNSVAKERRRLDAKLSRFTLNPRIDEISEAINQKAREQSGFQIQLNKANADLNVAKMKLARVQALYKKEKAQARPNPTKIRSFEADIAKFESLIGDVAEKKVPDLKRGFDRLQRELDQLKGDLSDFQSRDRAQVDSLGRSISQCQKKGDSLLLEMNSLVQILKVNGSIAIKTQPNGALGIDISKWMVDSDGNGRDFSTEPRLLSDGRSLASTIQNVNYNPKGGKLDFDAVLYSEDGARRDSAPQVASVFSFHLSRSNSHAGDQKIQFSGEVVKKKTMANGLEEVQKGVANFVDANE